MRVRYADRPSRRMSDQNAFEIATSRDIDARCAGRTGVRGNVVFALTSTIVSG